jgi:D-glycero-beta-D-manno-heptose 1-phosphate adenylyltransferase
MNSKLNIIQSKIIRQRDDLKSSLAIWKFQGKKIVFTNGCFDIMHRGHVEYLARAATYGNMLIVGLNTDTSVRKLKGKNRPLQDQESRALVLASMHYVDKVVLFEEETPYDLIRLVQPNVLIKGGDYLPTEIVGYDIVKAAGGKVVTIDFVDGYSTSAVIEKLKGK